MSKRIAWTLLRGLSTPNGGFTLRQELARGLESFNLSLGPTQGTYGLEIGMTRIEGSGLDRLPSTDELKNEWKIVAKDRLAETELTLFETARESQQQKQEYDVAMEKLVRMLEVTDLGFINEELGIIQKQVVEVKKQERIMKRSLALLQITAELVPSLSKSEEHAGEEEKARVPNIFTKCKVSQVLQSIPVLPNEDAFIAELGQVDKQHVKEHVKIHVGYTEETATQAAICYPFLQQQLQAIERVSHRNGLRMNKLFHDPVNEQAIAESDYTCSGPNETLPCFFNTLFYVQAKPSVDKVEETQQKTGNDCMLREGVARVVARMMERKSLYSTLAGFGLGVVCDGEHIVFMRMELGEDTGFPVYVSEVLSIAEGLHYLARMMCCSSAEQFGLPSQNLFELLLQHNQKYKLPSSYQYVRALGSGGFADVAVVRDEAGQSELVCKLVRDGADWHVLAHEARILGKLQAITTGVPRVVHYYEGEEEENGHDGRSSVDNHENDDDNKEKNRQSLLLTSPVGTPLLEHIKALHGEGERYSFARRVFEELSPMLSAVHAKGIVHGDIRPDNIVVTPTNEGTNGDVHVFLIDWGCAMEQGESFTDLQQQKQKEKPAWWKRRVKTPFMSTAILLGQVPTPRDDEQALLLTCVAIRESPIARAPWPHASLDSFELIAIRSRWMREYASKHTELDLTPLL